MLTKRISQCSSLSSRPNIADKIYFSSTANYDDSMDVYWSVSAALDPWCIAMPTEAQDVSEIITVLVENSCRFGVKGGGHGFWNGSNSVSDGVTIDFGTSRLDKKCPTISQLTRRAGFMNTTSYVASTKIASVSPGSHWQDVYSILSPQGVTVAGGRAGTVGVGGFVSGGGNSFFAASHGMACDTVQNFEVVLADGSIVNANAESNPDLFRAMKGGSANFGLITRIDMYAIEFPDASNPSIWGGILMYDLSAGDDLLDAMVTFNENVPQDLNTSSIIYWAYIPALGGMILNVALENTLGTAYPAATDVYLNVSGATANTMRTADLTVITEELGSGQPAGFRNIWYTLLLPNSADVMKHAVMAHEFAVSQLKTTMSADSGFNTLCMFQPINHMIAQHGADKGGNVLGLDEALLSKGPEKDADAIMFLATLAVQGAGNEANALPIMQNWTDSVAAYAEASGTSYGWHYLNYAYPNQDPLGSAGEEAIAKMKAASAKYDPDGVFQQLRTSGFKIPASY